ncbi:MAG: sulfite exporter TauE/SafE family protein [Oscillospiraceae bacterium]|jgi:uncharacterized membrane protein YfcA|nr:sulfite exporter TauE/SafE family protein [Oscillospiraceae bacterium]
MKKGVIGTLTGVINGMFGSGGGMLAVPLLESIDIETKKSHATSIALILPLSVISTIFYSQRGNIDWNTALKLVPLGLCGAVVGSILMKKLKSIWLKRVFGILLVIAGVRLLF